MSRAGNTVLPSFAIAVVGVLWGAYWIPTRWMQAHGVGPAWMSLATSLIILTATIPALLIHRSASRSLSVPGLLTGVCLAASFTLYNTSLILTTVVTAVLLFYVSPLWSTLLGWLIKGDRLSLPRLLALLLGFLGLVVTLGFDHGLPIPRSLGDWLAVCSGVIWAYGSIRSYSSSDQSILGNVLAFNLGAAATAGLALLVLPVSAAGAMPTIAIWQATLPFLAMLALLFVLPSTFILVWGTQRLPAPRVGILLMTEIVAGTLTAALLANEPFGPQQIAGALLILAAGVIEVLSRVPAKLQTRETHS